MKGLLLKDWYMLKKYCRSYLLIVVIFLIVSVTTGENVFFMVYPMLMAGVIGVTLISYDERSHWNVYCNTLPCTRSQQVHERYIFSLLIMAFTFLVIATVQLVRMLTVGPVDFDSYLSMMEMLLTTGTLPVAVLMPVVLRWGVEKGRIIYYVVIVAVVAMGYLFSAILQEGGEVLSQMVAFGGGISTMLPFLLAAVLALSWRISLKLYRTREI